MAVSLDGRGREMEALGDFLAGEACRDEVADLRLPRRKPLAWIRGTGLPAEEAARDAPFEPAKEGFDLLRAFAAPQAGQEGKHLLLEGGPDPRPLAAFFRFDPLQQLAEGGVLALKLPAAAFEPVARLLKPLRGLEALGGMGQEGRHGTPELLFAFAEQRPGPRVAGVEEAGVGAA